MMPHRTLICLALGSWGWIVKGLEFSQVSLWDAAIVPHAMEFLHTRICLYLALSSPVQGLTPGGVWGREEGGGTGRTLWFHSFTHLSLLWAPKGFLCSVSAWQPFPTLPTLPHELLWIRPPLPRGTWAPRFSLKGKKITGKEKQR